MGDPAHPPLGPIVTRPRSPRSGPCSGHLLLQLRVIEPHRQLQHRATSPSGRRHTPHRHLHVDSSISPRPTSPRSGGLPRLCTGGGRPQGPRRRERTDQRAANRSSGEGSQASRWLAMDLPSRARERPRPDRTASGTARGVTAPGHLRGGALGTAGRPHERRRRERQGARTKPRNSPGPVEPEAAGASRTLGRGPEEG